MKIPLPKRKKEDNPGDTSATETIPTRLQEISQEVAGKDSDLYWAISRIMFLDPKRITVSLEHAVQEATAQEATGNKIRAEVWYRIAGGIALYHGDVEAVRKFFEKASSIAGESRREYKVLANDAQKAVEISRKYYENI